MGMPPTWEKGSHLPPGTTKLGNLRDGCNSVTAPTAEPDLQDSSALLLESPPRDARNVTGCTGMLDELVGSHSKVMIYSTLTIHCKRLYSVPCSILGSRGMQVVTYPTNCQTTEARPTECSLKRFWVHAHEYTRYTVLPGYTLAP